MIEFPSELLDAAEHFLRVFIADRTVRPADLDEVLIGHMQNPFGVMMFTGPARTPFSVVLGRMMESGEVLAGQDDDGWWYKLGPLSRRASSP